MGIKAQGQGRNYREDGQESRLTEVSDDGKEIELLCCDGGQDYYSSPSCIPTYIIPPKKRSVFGGQQIRIEKEEKKEYAS